MHSFIRGITGRGQIFVYKLYTFFDGCYASVLPLQHFTFVLKQIVLTTMKRMLNRMLCYKGHKNNRYNVCVSRLARKT